MSELEFKSALITGASRGIGAASALVLAQSGVRRFLLQYNSYPEGAAAVKASLEALGAQVTLAQANLATVAGIDSFCAGLKPDWDILVNNAGSLVKRAKLLEYTPELFDEVMNLNVKSVYFITQKVAPGMIERKTGIVINVSSIAARNGGGPGATVYSAAKAAVAAITKGLAKELAPQGIRVNAVSPGTVDNHFHEVFSNRQILDSVIAQTPAGRLSTNEDVSDVIHFLCSPAARYIQGQTIEINGGMYMV
ncbi:MAG: SDR family oxidoreductase [Bryobacteraceae bacterium]|nr:SDR family oxidoreductase [Bryobacteraceae bacterium]